MKLFKDLKYIGTTAGILSFYGAIWHCTSFITRLSTGEMEFVVQPPHYHEGIFMGYTGLNMFVLTEDELVSNFKIVKEDGSLKNIQHSKNNPDLQKRLEKIDSYFNNTSVEELEKIINEN